jgi:hypothetical protein
MPIVELYQKENKVRTIDATGSADEVYEQVKKCFEPSQPRLSKEAKQVLFRDLCKAGPKIVIDCEFDTLMQTRE